MATSRFSRMYDDDETYASAVAVVGLACRLPGAVDDEELWRNLRAGRDTISHFTRAELLAAGLPRDVLDHPRFVGAAGTLEGIELFDAPIFGITAAEARLLDPQHRLFLETARAALEGAGYAPGAVPHTTGVFAGAGLATYLWRNLRHLEESGDPLATWRLFITNDKDFLPTRAAFRLGLTGPAINVQTACSTALVAIHLASQSLLAGECDMALAGASSVRLPHVGGYVHQESLFFSPAGDCRPFDAAAAGTVFGSGVGVVVLRRLSDALADGDVIRAIVLGTAVANDGARKGDYTAPSVEGQAQVVADALALGRVDPATIGMVEAHGAATAVGDPVEVEALTRAFGARARGPLAVGSCGLGSIKSNIGHVDTAAGVAGFIKAVLCLEHHELVPTVHFRAPHPALGLERTPFRVDAAVAPFPARGAPRRACVNSVGIGGTNAHVVLEEAPPRPPAAAGHRRFHVVALSARAPAALTELARRSAAAAAALAPEELADAAFTTAVGRVPLVERAAIVADSPATLAARLTALAAGETDGEGVARGRAVGRPRVAFLFGGQGAQHLGMGRALDETEPSYREVIDACEAAAGPLLGRSLRSVIYGAPGDRSLDDTRFTQPALYAVELGLARWLGSLGLQPAAVMGHSLGELVAATVAGALTLEEGVSLAAARGALLGGLAVPGRMLVTSADEGAVTRALARRSAGGVAVAAFNGPGNLVLSGEVAAIEALGGELLGAGFKVKALNVSFAAHSPLVEPILPAFAEVAGRLRGGVPGIPFVSNVTGQLEGGALDGSYWVRHLREPVRFADGVAALASLGVDVCVDLGPQPVLSGMARLCLPDEGRGITWLPSLRPDRDAAADAAALVAALHVLGATVDLGRLESGERRRLRWPTTPLTRERCFIDPPREAPARRRATAGDLEAMLGERLELPGSSEIRFATRLRSDAPRLLGDHRLRGQVVVPAAVHLAWILGAVRAALGAEGGVAIEDVLFSRAMRLGDEEERAAQLILTPIDGGAGAPGDGFALRVVGREDGWVEHASGRLRIGPLVPSPPWAPTASAGRRTDPADFYRALRGFGYDSGPRFEWATALERGEGWTVARLEPPAEAADVADFPLYPGLIDAAVQTLGACWDFEAEAARGVYFVPFRVGALRLHRSPRSAALVARSRLTMRAADRIRGDVLLSLEDGTLIAEILEFESRRVVLDELLAGEPAGDRPQVLELEWREASLGPAVEDGRSRLLLGDAAAVAEATAALAGAGSGARAGSAWPPPAGAADVAAAARALGPALADVAELIWLVPDAAPESLTAAGLALARAALAAPVPPRCLFVTRGAVPVTGPPRYPAGAAVWGLGRTLALEHPELGLRCLDLAPDVDAPRLARLVLAASPESELAAGRDETRAPRLRLRPARREAALTFDPTGAYVLTGGFGAIGAALAHGLVAAGARRLALLGRRGAPAGSTLTAALEAQGAVVVSLAVDLADGAATAAALAEVRRRLGPVRGVVHAAGVLADGSVLRLERTAVDAVFAGKVRGLSSLVAALEREDLDFLVLLSSVGALLGAPGQANYAAANAVLDASAAALRAEGWPAAALAFGPWAEVGLAASRSERDRARLAEWGLLPLAPAAGVGALLAEADGSRAIAALDAVALVRGLRARLGTAPLRFAELSADGPAPRRNTWRAAMAPLPPPARRAFLLGELRVLVARVLGLSDPAALGERDRLFDLGLDSLMAVDLKGRLEERLGSPLRSTVAFDFPTLGALADHLVERSGPAPSAVAAPAAVVGDPATGPALAAESRDLADLSEGELAELLDEELAREREPGHR